MRKFSASNVFKNERKQNEYKIYEILDKNVEGFKKKEIGMNFEQHYKWVVPMHYYSVVELLLC